MMPGQAACRDVAQARDARAALAQRRHPTPTPRPQYRCLDRDRLPLSARCPLRDCHSRPPSFEDVIDQAIAEEGDLVSLDGSPIAIDNCSATNSESGYGMWYSGKHNQHGGNVQVLCDPSGFPVWVGPGELRSAHDVTADERNAFPQPYQAAAAGLPTPTYKSWADTGIRARCTGPEPAHYSSAGSLRTRQTRCSRESCRSRNGPSIDCERRKWRSRVRPAA